MGKQSLKFFVLIAFISFTAQAFAQTNTISSTVIDKSVPAANAPSVVVNNSDVCVSSVSAGVTTQIFGLATGTAVRDKNCEVIKMFRLLYGGGMKVAAISLICNEDRRVWDAMWRAGTPCPAGDGLIGDEAKAYWLENPKESPEGSIIQIEHEKKERSNNYNSSDNDYWEEEEWQD
tara:strand:+ start:1236 stop:1763 length:528 start_codon:yes stop_codon:yes gene_type:complete